MRFTWGHAAIAIPVVIVIVFTSVLIISITKEQQTHLVVQDYYAKEIAFQDQIDFSKNAQKYGARVKMNAENNFWKIQLSGDFDPTQLNGSIVAFRPSDPNLDFELELELNQAGEQLISLNTFAKGKYQIQLRFDVNGDHCYLEKVVFIP